MTTPFRPWESSLPPVKAMQTFGLKRPPGKDFWRKATCEEVDCEHWRHGWRTSVDVSTDLGQEQADYIARHSGRKISRQYREGTIMSFEFEAGQVCFRAAGHRLAIEREPLYLHRLGDHRGNPAPDRVRRHTRGADWVDHMRNEFGKVADDRRKG